MKFNLSILLFFISILIGQQNQFAGSEACFSSKPVYIYAPSKLITNKHNRFHQELFSLGHAKPINKYTLLSKESILAWRHKPLNCVNDIAEEIKNIYQKTTKNQP